MQSSKHWIFKNATAIKTFFTIFQVKTELFPFSGSMTSIAFQIERFQTSFRVENSLDFVKK